MTGFYIAGRQQFADLLRMLANERPPYTEAKQRKYGLPVGEEELTVSILLTERCARILTGFTPLTRAVTDQYRWGSEVAYLLGTIERERIPDLPPGALSDRERQKVSGSLKLQGVPRSVRAALEPYRGAAEKAFAWTGPWPGPRRLKDSDVVEYLAERVLAGRDAPPRSRPVPKRKAR